MSENIKIFAQGANIAQDPDGSGKFTVSGQYDGAYGVILDDTSYAVRKERLTGFIPNTGASSVTLNTALHQQSVMAKILADVVTSAQLLKDNVDDITSNNYSDKANKFIDLLGQINGLTSGAVTAAKAEVANSFVSGGKTQNIAERFASLDSTNTLTSKRIDDLNAKLDEHKKNSAGYGEGDYADIVTVDLYKQYKTCGGTFRVKITEDGLSELEKVKYSPIHILSLTNHPKNSEQFTAVVTEQDDNAGQLYAKFATTITVGTDGGVYLDKPFEFIRSGYNSFYVDATIYYDCK